MSKLSDYLKTNKIDARRILGHSRDLERQTAEDRALVAKKAAIKAGKAEKNEEISKKKPRSGRRVTQPALDRALAGTALGGPTKTRIVRAVNAILVARKKAEVTFRDLF
jgi:hypothetical protein